MGEITLRHFNLSEFDSPDVPGSGSKMNREFLQMLDKAREFAGVPFKINSGYRTEEYNNSLAKSSPNSSHLKGRAADIHCTTSRDRAIIITSLLECGFDRIGIGKNFIHVDNDPSKSEWVFWLY